MLKIICISTFLLSVNSFSQTPVKPDPSSQINAVEQVHGLPGGAKGKAYSVKTTKRKSLKTPDNFAPVENTTPANCSDSLGGSGGATFTACEAGKRTR
jgi:hypothetical protein